jgi:hypothetical protein
LLNNIHKSSLIKGAICTVGLSGGGAKLYLYLSKNGKRGHFPPLAPQNYATGYPQLINLCYKIEIRRFLTVLYNDTLT